MGRKLLSLLFVVAVVMSLSANVFASEEASGGEYSVFSERQTGTVKEP
ncbi:hypothetical protein [Bacillus horti]|uniref:Uncharacterized protein n=1 Tax=Caldalkalibacillus horti TaxID=77523 RepID=A0ABT9W2C9_9BACI|nr:hypothetical protein [Bacillus horti]MDQ0166995.1 hypothetical protein [Bacillus horti]